MSKKVEASQKGASFKVYNPVSERAKWFKCGDCGEIQRYFERNPYGASYYLLTLLHRCSGCVRKIATSDNEAFQNLIKASEKRGCIKQLDETPIL